MKMTETEEFRELWEKYRKLARFEPANIQAEKRMNMFVRSLMTPRCDNKSLTMRVLHSRFINTARKKYENDRKSNLWTVIHYHTFNLIDFIFKYYYVFSSLPILWANSMFGDSTPDTIIKLHEYLKSKGYYKPNYLEDLYRKESREESLLKYILKLDRMILDSGKSDMELMKLGSVTKNNMIYTYDHFGNLDEPKYAILPTKKITREKDLSELEKFAGMSFTGIYGDHKGGNTNEI